ncbi:uncharacterized protein LOC135694960 isoform X2 [Rhopilema esculentum]|uniref:uncharacterized protein LOC135694960 isoform X2 n=1 Tax=Rhopilema esculentum TaxID=499914 RepID=UPI0031D8331F
MAARWRFLPIVILIVAWSALVEGSVYKNASHYWPLDYISEMKDLVTHKEATVTGTDGVQLNGKGDGFMEMQVGKAAIRLGEYNHKCMLSLANCDNGLTITFWLRLLEAPGSSNTVDLLSLRSSTGFYVIRVALESTSISHVVTYSATGSQAQYRARVSLALKQWMHSSLIFTKSGDLRVVINGKKILHSKRKAYVAEKTKMVNLIIGSWSKLGSSEGPKLQFDEIAVFFQELDVAAIRKIVLKDYGQISLAASCPGNKTSVIVAWEPPIDTYSHVLNYVITAKSVSEHTYTVPKEKTTATLTGLDADVDYQVELVARTVSGLNITSNKIICSTNEQKQAPAKGGLVAFAIDTDKIRVLWKVDESSVDKPVAYGVSVQMKGESAKYVLLFQKNALNHTISNLKENREYLVSVTVYTKLGDAKTENKRVKTKRHIVLPTCPARNLSVTQVTWGSVSVRWMPPKNYSDPAMLYEIECKRSNWSLIKEVVDEHVTFDNLQENTWYKIEVKVGAKGVGFYHETIAVDFRTQVRFPPPSTVNATALKWNTVLLEWSPVQRTDHLIYQVAYYEEKRKSKRNFIQTAETSLQISNLQRSMGYIFTVKIGNGIVFGKNSSKNVFVTTPDRDQCMDGSHTCSVLERCINIKDSYECVCKYGYIRSGETCTPMKKGEPSCFTDFARNVTWGLSKHGQFAVADCPKGTEGVARRFCKRLNNTHAAWLVPDLSNCVSTWLRQFSHQVSQKTQSSSKLMMSLSSGYAQQKQVSGGDIHAMVAMMGDIISITDSNSSDSSGLNEMAQSMVAVTDDLLSVEKSETWNDLPKKKKASSASRILQNFENLAQVYSSSLRNRTLKISKQNAVVEVKNLVDTSSLKFSALSDNGVEAEAGPRSSIAIPDFEFNSEDLNAVYFGFFRGIQGLLGTDFVNVSKGKSDSGDIGDKVSNVIAATVLGRKGMEFERPVVITLKLPSKNEIASKTLQCVFWDFAGNNTAGAWSQRGCKLHRSNGSHATCHCSHLTNFAVLMSVTSAPMKQEKRDEDRMALITTICIGISLAALFVSFLTFCTIRSLQSYRNTTHKNLVIALFLAQLLFVCGIDRTAHLLTCRLIGVALHYLFLVAFSLMGMEGVVLYMMLVRVYQRNTRYGNLKLLLACWGLPLVIVGITAGLDFTAYGNEKYCWINVKNGYIWSFAGPVILVVVFNCIIMALAVKVMRKKSKKREEKIQEIWYWIKCCSMLVSILGLSWILGIFYISQRSIIMAYIFSILNALQGLALFIFLCLLDQRVQDVYCRVLCCIEKGHFYLYASRSVSGTKSTTPVRHSREITMGFVKAVHRRAKVAEENQDFNGGSGSGTEAGGRGEPKCRCLGQ